MTMAGQWHITLCLLHRMPGIVSLLLVDGDETSV